jgi:diaminopimelate epimerase
MIAFTKAHAYGNDFLYVEARALTGHDLVAAARRLCDRHRGVGADGLIVYTPTPLGATMKLLNADGAPPSCPATDCAASPQSWSAPATCRAPPSIAPSRSRRPAGLRLLTLEQRDGARYQFAAEMGRPRSCARRRSRRPERSSRCRRFSMGNPQCVILGPLPDDARFTRLGPALERHPRFPAGTNVEFAMIERPDLLRIRIWERGVGPTTSSGTGSCGAAVAAAAHGGAQRRVEVVAPGGSQVVEWTRMASS